MGQGQTEEGDGETGRENEMRKRQTRRRYGGIDRLRE